MKECIICKSQDLYLIKKIEQNEIWECRACKLAFTTIKKNHNIDTLYDNTGPYQYTEYRKNEKIQKEKFRFFVEKMEEFVKRGDILEVGGGFGLLSWMLSKNKKYKVTVIEPHLSLKYVKDTQNVLRYKKTFQEFVKSNRKKSDCILFIDVLEHLDNPSKEIQQSRKILNNGGYFVVNLPNYKSLMATFCKNWSWWMIEDHKYHFSPKSIKLILEKNGFVIRYISTYESLYDFKKNLDGNFTGINNRFIRKSAKAFFFSLFFPVYIISRKFIWQIGYGGLIFCIAQKQ